MKKHLPHSIIFILFILSVLLVPRATFAFSISGTITDLAVQIPGAIASYVLLPLVGWITAFTGLVLNYVIYYTVVRMADMFPNGGAIDQAWSTIRDLANMGFIFVLLYTSIRTIFGDNKYRTMIVNIVIAAILINFSLFFTRVIIDASNMVALTFYDAIAPGAISNGGNITNAGLSNSIMAPLNVASIWKNTGTLEGRKLITIGIMGSIFALAAAFIFLAISILFIVRFVVLVFTMILSPLFVLGSVFPGIGGARKQWLDSLVGQAVFAPLFFLLMWIVLKLGGALYSGSGLSGVSMGDALAGTVQSGVSGDQVTASNMGLIFNFVLMIGMLVAAMIMSKKWATSGSKFIGQVSGQLTGAAGGLAFGKGLGGFGRNTLGKIAEKRASDPDLIKRSETSRAARLQLMASKKLASSSFDLRNASIPTGIGSIKVGDSMAGLAGVGKGGTQGFKEINDAKQKQKRDEVKARAEELRKADTKILIRSGEEAVKIDPSQRTPAQQQAVKDLVTHVKKLSPKEVESLKASTFSNPEIAEALSQKQMEAIEGSANFTPQEIQIIRDARVKKINDAFTAGHNPMPGATTAAAQAPGTPAPVGPTGYETAVSMIRRMSYADVAKMPESRLTDPGIFEIYTPKFLNKLGRTNELTEEKAQAIRNAVIAEANNPNATQNVVAAAAWLNGPGQNIF